MRKEPRRRLMVRLRQQASDRGTNQRAESPTPLLPDTHIDLTNGADPPDYPIVVLQRERLRRLRAENDELRQQVEVWRRWPDQLRWALARERDRAKHAEAENRHLLKRVRKLEAELSKLRPGI